MNQVIDNYPNVGGEERAACGCEDKSSYLVGSWVKGPKMGQWACENAESIGGQIFQSPNLSNFGGTCDCGIATYDYALPEGEVCGGPDEADQIKNTSCVRGTASACSDRTAHWATGKSKQTVECLASIQLTSFRYVKCRIKKDIENTAPGFMQGKFREFKVMNGFYPTYLKSSTETIRSGTSTYKELVYNGSGYLLHNAFKIERPENRENSDIIMYVRFNESTQVFSDNRWGSKRNHFCDGSKDPNITSPQVIDFVNLCYFQDIYDCKG
jgi:hypothetical protein